MKHILTMTAVCLVVALSDDLVMTQPADEPVSKVCREGPRAREIEIQKMEPFKVFDNLDHAGLCFGPHGFWPRRRVTSCSTPPRNRSSTKLWRQHKEGR